MKIHVLGVRGFIGKNIFEYFSSNYNIKGYSSMDCNLLDRNAITKKLAGISSEDVIIMTSSITRLKGNSLESMAQNIAMAQNMGNFISEHLISQFVFLSTTDVYGINPLIPITEKLSPNPHDYYAKSKFLSEFILQSSCSKRKIPLLILRLSGIYGKGDQGISVISQMVQSAKREGKIVLLNKGEATRDFVCVKDLCRILDRGIKEKVNGTFNVATGRSYSIKELANIIKKYIPEKIFIENKTKIDEQKRAKQIEFDISLLDYTFPGFNFSDIEKELQSYIITT